MKKLNNKSTAQIISVESYGIENSILEMKPNRASEEGGMTNKITEYSGEIKNVKH